MHSCIVCHQLYEQGRELTCSDECHEKLVKGLISEFGEYKKVIHQSTGVAYRVPTRDIIERGIQGRELDRYPRWEDTCHYCQWWQLLEEDPAVGGHGACHHPLAEAQYIAFTGDTAPGGLAMEGARRACHLFEQRMNSVKGVSNK